MRSPESKIIAFNDLDTFFDEIHSRKLKVVSTNGCFDLLHLGHIEYLYEARLLGDLLIVGLNSDLSVKKLKGNDRPLHSAEVRAKQLAALESVDHIVVFQEDTPIEFIKKVRPAIHAKGGDYDVSKLPERAVVESLGGKVVCLKKVDGYSSSNLIEKLKS